MTEIPFALLNQSQKLAVKVANEAYNALVAAGRAATDPEEAVRQLSTLMGAVGDLAGATAQPLQDLITRQQELAEMMATLARTQAELANVVDAVAQKHAAIVDSLDRLTAPVFGVLIRPEPPAKP